MSDEEGTLHIVRQGDTTTSLAFENGLFWETVWKHPENSRLRQLRKEPNVLKEGDEVFIPNRRTKSETRSTDQRHSFERKGVPEKLNLHFLDLYGKPYANEEYTLTIDGRTNTGKLDGDGWLRANIPPNARTGEVKVGALGCKGICTLDLGHLDPITEISGIQARLKHLGYYEGPVDGGADGEELEASIAKFRGENGLAEGSEVDDTFRAKLKEIYGV